MLCIFSVLPYGGFGMSIMTCGQMLSMCLSNKKWALKEVNIFVF
jgi:hypothetical protein